MSVELTLSGLKRDETFGWRGSSFAGAATQGGNEGPGQTTRTVKTVRYKPQAASAKCWGHFHLRKVFLEVKGPDGKKAPQRGLGRHELL